MESWQALRKQIRHDLIQKRESLDAVERDRLSAIITARLHGDLGLTEKNIIGFCWPYRGEYDPRTALQFFSERGATLALPEILAPDTPMQFRQWAAGVPTKPGAFDIPVPINTDIVTPQAVLLPLVGFDAAGYRLGYGGGYFDRTLALMQPRPLTIGVAFEIQRLASINPQPHDIAMDFIVTEAGVFRTKPKNRI